MPRFLFASVFAICASLAPASGADVTGAGATFPYPLYAAWAQAYKARTGIGVNYQSIGSGGGIKQIEAKTIDFGPRTRRSRPTSSTTPASSSSRWSWAALSRW